MNTIGIIPARYGATRFPGKPLVAIHGKPMIQRVYEQASASKLDQVVVATDDERIKKVVEGFGGQALMTSPDHPSGTDRVAEAAMNFPQAQLILNIQGDEPYIDPRQINQLIDFMTTHPDFPIGTMIKEVTDPDLIQNPNVVKVVRDQQHRALYFSRSAIPYQRDATFPITYFKHLGIYAYRAEALKAISVLAPVALEETEKLEQLRWLVHGLTIGVAVTEIESIAIDHPDDLHRLDQFIQSL